MTTSSPRRTVEAFVAAFVEDWPSGRADRVASFFSDDAVYHNIPLAPVAGRGGIEAAVAQMMALGGRVAVEVVNVVSQGTLVMVERMDHFVPDGGPAVSLPIAGVFEVRDGLITAWRDYFDLAPVASLGGSGPPPPPLSRT